MILFVFLGLILDQLSKFWVVNNLVFEQAIPIIPPILNFTYVHNDGAAWSIMEGQILFFVIITCIAVVLISFLYFTTPKSKKILRFAYTLLLAGALGNFVDRLRLGYVVDFIQVGSFPIFNIADCLLVCGAFLIAGLILFDEYVAYKQKKVGLAESNGAEILAEDNTENKQEQS